MGQKSFLFFNTAMLKITILFYYNFCRGFNMAFLIQLYIMLAKGKQKLVVNYIGK